VFFRNLTLRSWLRDTSPDLAVCTTGQGGSGRAARDDRVARVIKAVVWGQIGKEFIGFNAKCGLAFVDGKVLAQCGRFGKF